MWVDRVEDPAGTRLAAESVEQRDHDDGFGVDVAEAARAQEFRHPAPPPVDGRSGIAAQRRALGLGVDPHPDHRRLVHVAGVVAAQPAAQRCRVAPVAAAGMPANALASGRMASRTSTWARSFLFLKYW